MQEDVKQYQFYPKYRKASYANEFAVMQNEYLRIIWFKRLSGWGFAEIYTAEGKLMGVLDHLGELLVRDQEIPMRLEAESYHYEETPDSLDICFDVKTTVVQALLDGTSFAPWMHYPFTRPCLTGTVRVALSKTKPSFKYTMETEAGENMYVCYLRGPWIKAGEGSFGADKTDGIFPGIDWVEKKEWSSGNDWFRYPWSEKYAPDMKKVSVPCMAVSYDGDAIAMSWNPVKWSTRWFNYKKTYPQPVFAVPNFIDRDDNCLMGLMVPGALEERENRIYADPPLEVHLHEKFRLEATVFLAKGNSADAITKYFTENGLPEYPGWNQSDILNEKLRRIAHHYNTNLWDPEKGFGIPQRNQFSFHVPGFLRRFVADNPECEDTAGLLEKIAVCDARNEARRAQTPVKEETPQEKHQHLIDRLNGILAIQKEDGTFRFEPDGRHRSKDDFTVARVFCEPMGINNDTALDMNVLPALDLVHISKALSDSGDKENAAKAMICCEKALDYCLDMTRPEGGDFWETPLHAANLYAAGHAAIAYYAAYRVNGRADYRKKAIYWIRTLLPFTHSWEPENMKMLYDTKPCFCSSDWYFANWVRDHVQWEVLSVFNQSEAEGIRWNEIDREIDWLRYQAGITLAACEWMVDSSLDRWMPHNIPSTYDDYARGAFDGCFPDTHNAVTGNYGGMFIMPSPIADNLYAVIDRIGRGDRR